MQYVDKLAPYVAYVEGPNEVNNVSITFTTPGGVKLYDRAAADAYQAAMYAAVKADPLLKNALVMTFSLAPGRSYAGYGNLAAYADATSVHAYGQYGVPPQYFLKAEITAVTLAPGKPFIVTEAGDYTMPNHDTGVNEDVQAKLIMDTLLDDFKMGVKQTYIYQLLDAYYDPNNTNAEFHYGLFHSDGTPKISGTAIHDLTAILGDSTANARSFTTTPLAYSVTGLPSTGGSQFLLQKSNGAYDIALWQEPYIWNKTTNTEVTFAPTTVTITLGHVYQTINVYNPLVGLGAIATYHNVSSVQVALGTGAMVVEIEPDSTGKYISTGAAGGVFTSTGPDTVVGGSGAATVNASGAATITGSTGDLTVVLTGSNASVIGGAGALTVADNGGSNNVTGGTGAFTYTDVGGNDLITTGTSNNNQVTLGGGSDTVLVRGATILTAGPGMATVILSSAGSSISGDGGALIVTDKVGGNTVTGGAGALTFTDLAGGDLITTGTSGNDQVTLGAGSDTVAVLGGTTLTAGAGAASVTLSSAGSSITGGAGALTVTDNGGGNTVAGGSGVFTFTDLVGGDLVTTGTSGNDQVTLGAGSDTVSVVGATTLTGGAGTASVILGSVGSSITGGAGALTVTDNGGGNTVTSGSGVLTFTDLVGGDLITTGTSGSDQVTLGAGSDTVAVLAATTLTSGAGVASVTLSSSGSSITGGSGTLGIIDNGGGNTVTGGTGALALTALAGGDVITTNNTTGISSVLLSIGTDTVTVNGATSLYTNQTNVTITGNSNLSIDGGLGSMTLVGNIGDEYVFTQTGTHNLLNLGSGKNSVLSHGADTINASTASGASSTYVYAAGPDLITGGAGLLSVNGRGAAVTVLGGTGAVKATAIGDNSYLKGGSLGGNVLSAAGGNTTLVGGGSGDTLTDTGAGNNMLIAAAGGATLTAGSGNDTLVGGAGGDVFVLTQASAAHSEVIQNFKVGTDQLSFVGFSAAPIASQRVVSGSLQLTLTDQTHVTLTGVTSLG